jgi:hypothetical protein
MYGETPVTAAASSRILSAFSYWKSRHSQFPFCCSAARHYSVWSCFSALISDHRQCKRTYRSFASARSRWGSGGSVLSPGLKRLIPSQLFHCRTADNTNRRIHMTHTVYLPAIAEQYDANTIVTDVWERIETLPTDYQLLIVLQDAHLVLDILILFGANQRGMGGMNAEANIGKLWSLLRWILCLGLSGSIYVPYNWSSSVILRLTSERLQGRVMTCDGATPGHRVYVEFKSTNIYHPLVHQHAKTSIAKWSEEFDHTKSSAQALLITIWASHPRNAEGVITEGYCERHSRDTPLWLIMWARIFLCCSLEFFYAWV